MTDWTVPPPHKPFKTREELAVERERRVEKLIREGYLRSAQIKKAILGVPRECFIPEMYRDYAYEETPLPIPGGATISCPHSYPLFYEALGLKQGDRFLEIGLGSGYGTALAREVVGEKGRVISIEINRVTFLYAKRNLKRLGYRDIILFLDDGGLGCPDEAPFDRICITASCPKIPLPLIDQLKPGGRLISPVGDPAEPEDLVLLKKDLKGRITAVTITQVSYMALRGRYGFKG